MEPFLWIIPALGVIGVPLIIAWVKSQMDKGDKALDERLKLIDKAVLDNRDACKKDFDDHVNRMNQHGERIRAIELAATDKVSHRELTDAVDRMTAMVTALGTKLENKIDSMFTRGRKR